MRYHVLGKDVVQAGGQVVATCLSHEFAEQVARALNTLDSIDAHRSLIKSVTSLEKAHDQRQP